MPHHGTAQVGRAPRWNFEFSVNVPPWGSSSGQSPTCGALSLVQMSHHGTAQVGRAPRWSFEFSANAPLWGSSSGQSPTCGALSLVQMSHHETAQVGKAPRWSFEFSENVPSTRILLETISPCFLPNSNLMQQLVERCTKKEICQT